jgi:antitoxin HicB
MTRSRLKRVQAYFFAMESGRDQTVTDDTHAGSRSCAGAHAGTSAERSMKKSSSRTKRVSRTGGKLASALAADDLLEDAEAVAIKRVLAWQLEKSMKTQGVSKQALAQRMSTSRSQLDRLLDPKNSTVQLDTIARAARALGKRLELRLIG